MQAAQEIDYNQFSVKPVEGVDLAHYKNKIYIPEVSRVASPSRNISFGSNLETTLLVATSLKRSVSLL